MYKTVDKWLIRMEKAVTEIVQQWYFIYVHKYLYVIFAFLGLVHTTVREFHSAIPFCEQLNGTPDPFGN